MKKQLITILGATGSIGLNALKIIELHPDLFALFALTAHQQKEKLLELCIRYQPRYAVISEEKNAEWLRKQLKGRADTDILAGDESLNLVARTSEVDVVISAIVGAAGAVPTFAAAEAGKKILLANKETLVMAGDLFTQLVKNKGALVLPVDSEHNAIFQIFPQAAEEVQQIILTASGGPFLNKKPFELKQVTISEALKHPNWKMGRKISIDSATMMNKALEVIEAAWLFNLPPEKIEVLIHPESIIHSMIRLIDESVLAQLSVADMCLPIEYCLAYPKRIQSGVSKLDFSQLSSLHFYPVEPEKFPALTLAYQALRTGRDAGCILNAANEVAVELFLENKIRFVDIYSLVAEVMNDCGFESHLNLESLLNKDKIVRILTKEKAKTLLMI